MPAIAESTILILATHGFEQSELEVPRDRLRPKGSPIAGRPAARTATANGCKCAR